MGACFSKADDGTAAAAAALNKAAAADGAGAAVATAAAPSGGGGGGCPCAAAAAAAEAAAPCCAAIVPGEDGDVVPLHPASTASSGGAAGGTPRPRSAMRHSDDGGGALGGGGGGGGGAGVGYPKSVAASDSSAARSVRFASEPSPGAAGGRRRSVELASSDSVSMKKVRRQRCGACDWRRRFGDRIDRMPRGSVTTGAGPRHPPPLFKTPASQTHAGHQHQSKHPPTHPSAINRGIKINNNDNNKKVVDLFYARVLGDPSLAPLFEAADMAKLKRHQVVLMELAFGGKELVLEVRRRRRGMLLLLTL